MVLPGFVWFRNSASESLFSSVGSLNIIIDKLINMLPKFILHITHFGSDFISCFLPVKQIKINSSRFHMVFCGFMWFHMVSHGCAWLRIFV